MSAPQGETKPAAGPGTRTAPQPPANTAPAVAADTLRIGTWNIEWFGSPAKRSGIATGTAQSSDDVADYIIASGVCVLAVEEVVASGQKPRSEALDATLAAIKKRAGDQWKYILFPDRRGEEAQLTGVLWNPKLITPLNADGKAVADGESTVVPLSPMRGTQTKLWNKPPHAMKFSAGAGKTDFVVIVVHMKADYNGDFALTRDEEAKNLAAALPAVRKFFKDEDIVVLGDTNMTKSGEPLVADFESAGLYDLNRKNERTNWREGAMDRIFVASQQPEFAERRFEVMSDRYLDPKRWDARNYKKRLSDHYMAVTVIKVIPDDD
ncbi:MAG: hypothetical protein ACREJO_13485 [Phycisphaerales bacterium]